MNNAFSREEAHLPRTFQSRPVLAWIADLRYPRGLDQHRYLSSLVSGFRAKGICVDDIACRNMAPSIQPFLTPPDLLLCWVAQKWISWEHVLIADISLFSEELIEKYRALAKLADR